LSGLRGRRALQERADRRGLKVNRDRKERVCRGLSVQQDFRDREDFKVQLDFKAFKVEPEERFKGLSVRPETSVRRDRLAV
jgi:hypothetical protein